ncbi:hypothetical protein GCK72_012401 [Caenorhabditis remanei]|uniref:Uncharacterized protein n=1 Tax=Caenorhabditis remanei TaxID=31234 RepID=A0A6A5GKU3_CAERE|nr:hypothetical protein GCK72_012401 [Caenorhabditis remanei]KAF1755948.1 hypothetical protein GCK72_012401 [Caenorhabditis remanei]
MYYQLQHYKTMASNLTKKFLKEERENREKQLELLSMKTRYHKNLERVVRNLRTEKRMSEQLKKRLDDANKLIKSLSEQKGLTGIVKQEIPEPDTPRVLRDIKEEIEEQEDEDQDSELEKQSFPIKKSPETVAIHWLKKENKRLAQELRLQESRSKPEPKKKSGEFKPKKFRSKKKKDQKRRNGRKDWKIGTDGFSG